MDKLISVIIPVYNSAEWLSNCLDSVVNQTYTNIEVIVVNDASTDCSDEILAEYVRKYKNFEIVNHERNRGVGAARNSGCEIARGEYITFLDSDDEWTDDYCETLINIIDDADIAIAGRATFVDGQYTKSKTADRIICVDTITAVQYDLLGKYSAHPAWGKLFKRELIEDLRFDEEYVFEDIRFSIDTMLKAKKVVFSDKDMYHYKMRKGSIMTSNIEKQIRDYVFAAEYVYRRLHESHRFSSCIDAFKVFLARGIIRNTRQFVRSDVNDEFFRYYNSRIIDLYESTGGI